MIVSDLLRDHRHVPDLLSRVATGSTALEPQHCRHRPAIQIQKPWTPHPPRQGPPSRIRSMRPLKPLRTCSARVGESSGVQFFADGAASGFRRAPSSMRARPDATVRAIATVARPAVTAIGTISRFGKIKVQRTGPQRGGNALRGLGPSRAHALRHLGVEHVHDQRIRGWSRFWPREDALHFSSSSASAPKP